MHLALPVPRALSTQGSLRGLVHNLQLTERTQASRGARGLEDTDVLARAPRWVFCGLPNPPVSNSPKFTNCRSGPSSSQQWDSGTRWPQVRMSSLETGIYPRVGGRDGRV